MIRTSIQQEKATFELMPSVYSTSSLAGAALAAEPAIANASHDGLRLPAMPEPHAILPPAIGYRLFAAAIPALLSLLIAASPLQAASPAARETALISLLKSNAPPAEKALACKQLAICGTTKAVPALAPFLSDPQLASWARIALEAIPGSASDDALRRAMGKLHGPLLVGVINSIGVRRDTKAAGGLEKCLKDKDPDVASAAAVALGHIGGKKVAKALNRSLAAAPDTVRPAVAEGCILCAEQYLAQDKPAEAMKLYDAVRAANVPRQKQLEAIRGAILARQSDGLPLLLEQLRSPDKALFGIGLRTARELPGREVTEALAAELRRCELDRQPYLLLALADRSDAAVMPAVLEAAGSGPKKLRLVAVGILDRLSNVSSLPVLLNVAADSDAELSQAALTALARLPGNEVDTDFLDRLPVATGKSRQVLFDLAGLRHMDRAIPVIMNSLHDPDAGVRAAAVRAIGILGNDAHAPALVQLLQESQSAAERGDLEKALLAISARAGARTVPALLPLAHNTDSRMRIVALSLLASAGGPHALEAVQLAIQDKDEAVQDEAVRTLSTWPNNWPEDSNVAQPLLTLAKSGVKPSHQVLALRGYFQYLQGDKQLRGDEKLGKISEVWPLIKRLEEKRQALAVIVAVPNARALDMLAGFIPEPDLTEDACSAIVRLVESSAQSLPQEQRLKALQTVVQKTANETTKQEANKLLKSAH